MNKQTFITSETAGHNLDIWLTNSHGDSYWFVGDTQEGFQAVSGELVDLLQRTSLECLYEMVANDNSHIRKI